MDFPPESGAPSLPPEDAGLDGAGAADVVTGGGGVDVGVTETGAGGVIETGAGAGQWCSSLGEFCTGATASFSGAATAAGVVVGAGGVVVGWPAPTVVM